MAKKKRPEEGPDQSAAVDAVETQVVTEPSADVSAETPVEVPVATVAEEPVSLEVAATVEADEPETVIARCEMYPGDCIQVGPVTVRVCNVASRSEGMLPARSCVEVEVVGPVMPVGVDVGGQQIDPERIRKLA